MAFDQSTRNRLQKLVSDCRRLLSDEFSIQLQQTYGIDPHSGEVTSLRRLSHLSDRDRQVAQLLRDTLAHYLAVDEDDKAHRIAAIDRIIREQAFTVLNRLAALLMMEARGLLAAAVVSQGQQSQAFELYKMVAGSALGETGEAYRTFLFSLFDEFAIDLPALFDRHAAQGRLFPREPALLLVLEVLNHHEIQPLWAEDETIGWIYQYFNSKEERKAMRDAKAPRNSRELAVRNQFFTPRYVVEFLVDNSLGRLWFNATGGQTELRERCQYLLVKPDEQPQASVRLRDPRTLKLLDPACGSMHFGLYAFDLFLQLYQEAWDWEQANGPGSLDVSTQAAAGLLPLSHSYADQEAYLRDVPRLIIEHNIYGVDIDPRAAQIASLALWLRAQRAWHDAGVKAQQRPNVGRGHVVAAVAPPAERELRQQFAANLDTRDAELFEKTLQLLKGLPELGVLLQVERELPSLIRQVYLGRGNDLFAAEEQESWEQAESRLRSALFEFAHAAKSTYQGQLFAQDALEGLRLVDLSCELFDVVVMNPPFGAASLGAKGYLTEAYPDSSNDLLGIFVERGLSLLRRGGRLGAITSRTCFFLTSFNQWRQKVVLGRSCIELIADLGQGVMDDAMVEAAAYVLERGSTHQVSNVIRAISEGNRQLTLDGCALNYRTGQKDPRIFTAEKKTFDLLPDSPFVYWVNAETVKQFECKEHFEPDVGTVRVGLQTGDDPRFVRTVWEVAPKDTQFCYYPSNDDAFCSFDDPIVQDYFRRRHEGNSRWAFHVKAGASQPWYSPITLKLNYADDGAELRGFKDSRGKPRAYLRSKGYYYRSGFSWTRRAVRFYPYVIPSGCIPSVSRYMAFPEPGRETEALGVCASRLASAFLRFYGEKFEFPNFLVENVKMLPWPKLKDEAKEYFAALITREVEKRRQAYQNFEPFHEFVLPTKIRDYSDGGSALAFDRHSLIGEEGERLVADAYGLSSVQAEAVERDLKEAIVHQHGESADSDDETSGEDSDFVLDTSPYATEEAHISYLLGCVFGRWDIRFATGQRQPELQPNPFAPLPACPPGMLQNERGLPATEYEIPEGYPLPIAWSGVLVEDEGSTDDIIERLQEAARVIWGARADSMEEGAYLALGVKSLREYFQRSNKFFADHLKRYSKSSRKAPIYWPLATASGSYTLWLYYPSLSDQTLFTAVNNFVDPKLKDIREQQQALRDKGAGRSKQEEKSLEALANLESELADLRDSLLEIAPNYRPNHDDGVQITAAPLWKLFRLKPWQKVLKDTWAKLEKGDYDWAHLAMNYWPDRVRDKCITDKSLAIAHSLEHLYIEPEPTAKKTRGRKKAGSTE